MVDTSLTREATGLPRKHGINTVLMLVASIVAVAVLLNFVLRPGGWSETGLWSATGTIIITALVVVGGLWLCLAVAFRRRIHITKVKYGPAVPYSAGEYAAAGLGPQSGGDAAQLYIDLMKRCVANILYEDQPLMFFNGDHGPVVAGEFDLHRRIAGQDMPTAAHTMIGIRRLDNIEQCFNSVIERDVPGDFAETGSYRGGATIFMRALLKARGITNRRVFVCDAFVPMESDLPPRPFLPLLRAIASIPGRKNRRRLYKLLECIPQRHRPFPLCENPSDDWIDIVLWTLRHPETIGCGDTTSRAHVESRFARYGLMDEQVVLLEGYFADTLPTASFDSLALLRLDGDTYESTRDAIEQLYPRLSAGGFCIVDDYHAFDDCRRAIEDYRRDHNIQESIQEIDNMGVFWQKDWNVSSSGRHRV